MRRGWKCGAKVETVKDKVAERRGLKIEGLLEEKSLKDYDEKEFCGKKGYRRFVMRWTQGCRKSEGSELV